MKKANDKINESGSVYIEMLLAFFVWLIILGFVIPSLMTITMNRKELISDNMANEILAKQFTKLIYNEQIDSSVTLQGYPQYIITLNLENENTKELCIRYERKNREEKLVCRHFFDYE